MSQSEREGYRHRYAQVAPEVSKGLIPSVKSDTFSFFTCIAQPLKEKERQTQLFLNWTRIDPLESGEAPLLTS